VERTCLDIQTYQINKKNLVNDEDMK